MDQAEQHQPDVHYRQASSADNRAAHRVLAEAFAELDSRIRPERAPDPDADTPEAREAAWQRVSSLYDHLARNNEHYWIAEHDGAAVGYARTTIRDGVRELNELAVAPGRQAGGVGSELLRRAFPADGARGRVVIAAPNPVAQVLYLRAGVYPRFPIAGFSRPAELVDVPPALQFRPLQADQATLAMLAEIDAEVIGFRRDPEQRWLIGARAGYLVLRDGRPVGYGYIGAAGGPWALLDAGDVPAALAFAEREAARNGYDFSLQVPLINQHVVDYLLGRGCRMSPNYAQFMTDQPLGSFERYIVTSPMFFV